MKSLCTLVSASLFLLTFSALQAQTVLVDWDHTWNYLHPNRGVLPGNAGPQTPHPVGTTPWFADQVTFDDSYVGLSFETPGPGFDAGSGPGPLGYGAITYTTTPLPPPAEFAALGTTLDTPVDGFRETIYFRTTFTVPDDGETYNAPVIRYLFDDGGFVYLDGEMILEVNTIPGDPDEFILPAANTTDTETVIRRAELDLQEFSLTGDNTDVSPPAASNAVIVKQIPELAPGVHTLAVSLHNQSDTSSDQAMALQLIAGLPDCFLEAEVTNLARDTKGTLNDPGDDTIDVTLRVAATGIFGAGWEITEPAASGAFGQGGAYDAGVTISGIAISEFAGGALPLLIVDVDDPSCSTRLNIFPPRIIAADVRSGPPVPIVTSGPLPAAGWEFDDVARTLFMNNGGGGARLVVRSSPLDLSTSGPVEFSGVLEIQDNSSGNEADDSFVAYLIIDGDNANPVNLITPHDTISQDGILTDDELAPSPGNFIREMNHTIPATARSVQIVIEGINNSGSENFTVRDMEFSGAPPGSLQQFFNVEASGDDLILTWESQSGFLYNVRSETNPSAASLPLDWTIFDNQTDLAATPPLNTLTVARPADPERYFVIESFPAPPSAVFEDDFESGQGGWTVGSDLEAGTVWELGVPTNGPPAANSPENCFGTNLASDYTEDVEVWLRSPPIDLTSAASATVNYAQFYDIELMFDFGQVAVLDAADDALLGLIQLPFDGTTFSWEQVKEPMPTAALGKTVKLEFRFVTDNLGNFAGWYIDDVVVTVP